MQHICSIDATKIKLTDLQMLFSYTLDGYTNKSYISKSFTFTVGWCGVGVVWGGGGVEKFRSYLSFQLS